MNLKALPSDRGKRLDAFLHERLPEFSRSRLQSWIREGRAIVSGRAGKPSYTIRGGEEIALEPAELPPLKATPEKIPLTVLYEDPAVVAIDKPPGMVVHAGAGVHHGTVVNALLHRFGALSQIGGELRPGIVHRLDRFTSGVLAVAKTDEAHRDLALQFSSRKVEKIYLTLVEGSLSGSGRITKPISRDPKNRARMTAKLATGRPSLTEWEALERFVGFTFLRIRLGTGRTHQIRAHMAALGHPVAGDHLYGAKRSPWNRYFLHAHRLGFRSPATGEPVTVESPLPPDLTAWKDSLLQVE
ncbi:MAG TPA: RluA family pseudouridine synthase [Bryobacteraceae bacterium]|nr:RluA family pseudouridine synthase [Bryobacteraceae bacterium]